MREAGKRKAKTTEIEGRGNGYKAVSHERETEETSREKEKKEKKRTLQRLLK